MNNPRMLARGSQTRRTGPYSQARESSPTCKFLLPELASLDDLPQIEITASVIF
jgi:hypothetical protein